MCAICRCDDDDWEAEEAEEDEEVSVNSQKPGLTPEAKIQFIELLLSDNEDAIEVVADFLADHHLDDDEIELPTEAVHTIWFKGTPDDNGFHIYRIGHNLNSMVVGVALLDTTESYSWKVTGPNEVIVVSPEELWGTDVRVWIP